MLRMGVGAIGQMDPVRFQHALDLFVAGLNLVPHHLLTGTAMYQFARMAQRIASLGGNPLAFIKDYLELMQQLGRTGGRGVAYFGIKLAGGQLTTSRVGTLERSNDLKPLLEKVMEKHWRDMADKQQKHHKRPALLDPGVPLLGFGGL